MNEYSEVEQPPQQQLATLGWTVIDQGAGVPGDPSRSLRGSFRDWLLPRVPARRFGYILAVTKER